MSIFEYLGVVSLPVFLVTFITVLLIVCFLKDRPTNLPPGPTGLPYVGYLPFLGPYLHVQLSELAKKYGNVMSFTVLGKTVIYLNNYETTREAFLKRGDEFTGRPDYFNYFGWITDNQGISESEGKTWQEHRRFVLRSLREFRFGKLSLEGRILEIAKDIVKVLKETKETPYDMFPILTNSTANVISSFLFDKHYDHQDPEFVNILSLMKSLRNALPELEAFLPKSYLKYIPICLSPNYKDVAEFKKRFHAIMSKYVKEHESTYQKNNLRNYLDAYIQHKYQIEKEERMEESSFTLERLSNICVTMFIAGTETTSTLLCWGMKLVTIHPEIQDRIYNEIESVVGRERLPSFVDRASMPFTEATLMELQRFSSIVPIGLIHSNFEETTLCGYTIPKRCVVLANLWNIHRDPKFWPEPEKFDPTRFLGSNGKIVKKDRLIPFSIGKRACLGESLAKMELFLFFTSILQSFQIIAPEGNSKELQYRSALISSLKPFNIIAIPRD